MNAFDIVVTWVSLVLPSILIGGWLGTRWPMKPSEQQSSLAIGGDLLGGVQLLFLSMGALMTRADRQHYRDLSRKRRALTRKFKAVTNSGSHGPTEGIRLRLRDVTTAMLRLESGSAA